MHVLITGANGFVGRQLAARLLKAPGASLEALTLVDVHFDAVSHDPRVHLVEGSIAELGVLRGALARPVDRVFHLASIPGGMAEREYELGRQVNLDATLDLLELLRQQSVVPRVVFASTIAVYGAPPPAQVDEDTPLHPQLSYGAHKLIGEILVEDFSRRGWIDGVSVRLPGIVPRPPHPSGLLSGFMSEIFWKLAAGEAFTCPVSPQAVAWWMSVACCVDNLVHAAELRSARLPRGRALALPVLRFTIADLVDALARRYGEDRRALVHYAPDEALEGAFGRYPLLDARHAESLGFRHDGTIDTLIRNALG